MPGQLLLMALFKCNNASRACKCMTIGIECTSALPVRTFGINDYGNNGLSEIVSHINFHIVSKLSSGDLQIHHDGLWHGNAFGITGHLSGNLSHQWISLTKGQWCGAFMFPLLLGWATYWTKIRVAGDIRPREVHVIVMNFTTIYF